MNIWIDVDNAPHVLVLHPIIRELEARGHTVEITTRDFGQTIPLLELYGLEYQAVGRHAGKNKLKKGISLIDRSVALWRWARVSDFDVALCHGARGVVLPARWLKIPLVVLMDYEHSFSFPFRRWASRILMPEVIPDDDLKALRFDLSRVGKYPGLKEEFYVYDLEPCSSELDEIGVHPEKILAVARPPATMAHYHAEESERLFWYTLEHLVRQPEVQVICLPRTNAQAGEIRARLDSRGDVVMPTKPLKGPNLLWHADLVVGGGGTMNREAACLGVPAYSVFRGPIGGVDRHLVRHGRLRFIECEQDIHRIALEKRSKVDLSSHRESSHRLVERVTDHVLEVAGI